MPFIPCMILPRVIFRLSCTWFVHESRPLNLVKGFLDNLSFVTDLVALNVNFSCEGRGVVLTYHFWYRFSLKIVNTSRFESFQITKVIGYFAEQCDSSVAAELTLLGRSCLGWSVPKMGSLTQTRGDKIQVYQVEMKRMIRFKSNLITTT